MESKRTTPVYRVGLDDIAKQWDAIVDLRHKQIQDGVDLSYNFILRPTVLELLDSGSHTRLIDVGCGSGDLSASLAQHCEELVGVDVSPRSVDLAQSVCRHLPNASFRAASIEEFASGNTSRDFSVAVANMMLMTAPYMDQAVEAVAGVLSPSGTFIVTITHPCFWPQYWGYDRAGWFRYELEVGVEAPFRISRADTSSITTHFHRPLSGYVAALTRSGFVIEKLLEPMPDVRTQERYPEPWQFPRFLALKCRLVTAARTASDET